MARKDHRRRTRLSVSLLGIVFASVLLAHADDDVTEQLYKNDLEVGAPNSVSRSRDVQSADWPRYSFDLSNTNHNPAEWKISPRTVPTLVRAWQTFNDDALLPASPPTGFVLEAALGLQFRASVVGVVSLPVIRDGTIYYIDQLGTMFARDAKTGRSLEPYTHWTTTLVDPDFDGRSPAVAPDLFYTAVTVTKDHVWVLSSVFGRLHAVADAQSTMRTLPSGPRKASR